MQIELERVAVLVLLGLVGALVTEAELRHFDAVTVEMPPYDLSKGRIVYRGR